MSESATDTADTVRTGVPEVDAAIDAVTALDDVPVEQHPGVFEAAHEALRRALDGGS
jgi:hypothetical protein